MHTEQADTSSVTIVFDWLPNLSICVVFVIPSLVMVIVFVTCLLTILQYFLTTKETSHDPAKI